jgi:hypothetical protein
MARPGNDKERRVLCEVVILMSAHDAGVWKTTQWGILRTAGRVPHISVAAEGAQDDLRMRS